MPRFCHLLLLTGFVYSADICFEPPIILARYISALATDNEMVGYFLCKIKNNISAETFSHLVFTWPGRGEQYKSRRQPSWMKLSQSKSKSLNKSICPLNWFISKKYATRKGSIVQVQSWSQNFDIVSTGSEECFAFLGIHVDIPDFCHRCHRQCMFKKICQFCQ